LKEQNSGRNIYIWTGTRAEYNALDEIIENCLYIVEDDTTIEDIEKSIEELLARIESNETAFAEAITKTANDINKRITDERIEVDHAISTISTTLVEYSTAVEERFTDVEGRVADLEAFETATVNITKAEGASGQNGNFYDVEISGTITFRRQGKIATANVNLTMASQYALVNVSFLENETVPAIFRPSAIQYGTLYAGAYHSELEHYAALAAISAGGLQITIKQETGTFIAEKCHWVGAITYFI
jgi:hypothetical protein